MHCAISARASNVLRRAGAMVIMLTITLTAAHSQTPRNVELERIRGEITKLKKRLDTVRAETKSAQRELEAVDLELDIRTRELQIAVDSQAQLEGQET